MFNAHYSLIITDDINFCLILLKLIHDSDFAQISFDNLRNEVVHVLSEQRLYSFNSLFNISLHRTINPTCRARHQPKFS